MVGNADMLGATEQSQNCLWQVGGSGLTPGRQELPFSHRRVPRRMLETAVKALLDQRGRLAQRALAFLKDDQVPGTTQGPLGTEPGVIPGFSNNRK